PACSLPVFPASGERPGLSPDQGRWTPSGVRSMLMWARSSVTKRPHNAGVRSSERSNARVRGSTPWVVAIGLPPLRKEVGELVIDPLGQHDAHADELIAGAAIGGVAHALALEAEGSPRTRAFGDGELHASGNGGDLDLGPEHGFVDGDRHIEL